MAERILGCAHEELVKKVFLLDETSTCRMASPAILWLKSSEQDNRSACFLSA